MPREPEVLTGAREPRLARRRKSEQGPGSRAALREQAALSVPEKTVFQSDIKSYRLQLTSNATEYLPGGRAAKKPKDLVVVFRDGIAVLDTKKDAEAIALALEHANYKGNPGGRGLFWLLKDAVEAKKAEANAAAADTLLNNTDALTDPALRAKIIEALKVSGGDDFDLGGIKPKQAFRPSAG